jgi:carboxymethylenebutenolidase
MYSEGEVILLCGSKESCETGALRITSRDCARVRRNDSPQPVLLILLEHPSTVNFFGTEVRISNTAFQSAGKSITLQQFLPVAPGRYPAVLALHGSGGIREGWAEQPSRLLAGQGYSVFVVHFFERTDTLRADYHTTQKNFPDWMRTIGDAVTFAAQHDSVDPNRVGLLGFSLGAFLSLAVASVDVRVKAVVDFFGGMPEELQGFQRMPPVLILHGEDDRVVPVSEATKLQQLLERAGTPYEIKLYPGAGHGFNGLQLMDAGRRTVQFLNKYL